MIKICSGPECKRSVVCKGMCSGHYQQARIGKELRPLKNYATRGDRGPCPIYGCDRPTRSRGVCDRHMSICNRHHVDPGEYIRLYALGCANPKCENVVGLQVDHDHSCCPGATSCGECVRGLLCRACNLAAYVVESGTTSEALAGVHAYLQMDRPVLKKFEKVYR